MGGVLRDWNGNWVVGFQRFVGRGTTFNAKMWGILHGLQVAIPRGLDKVIFESDCLVVINLINECLHGSPSTTIVRKIVDTSKLLRLIRFQYAS